MSRSWLIYLDDLIASAEKIGRFVAGRTELSSAGGVGPARLRDLIAHHYFAIDSDIIWEVAQPTCPGYWNTRADCATK